MNIDDFRRLLDHCCGPAPKPFVKPKPMTGIERYERDLDFIDQEFNEAFRERKS